MKQKYFLLKVLVVKEIEIILDFKMATAAADTRPEEVEGNQEILNAQNLDYSGLHCTITY